MTLWVGLSLVLVCVLAQGFFSGSEMALVSANRTRLEALSETGNKGAAKALSLLREEDRLLATCLVGTNLAVISGSTVTTLLLIAAGRPEEWLATALFLPFALVLGEALPKTVYQHHANTLAPVLAWPVGAAQTLFAPVLWLVSRWTSVLKRLASTQQRLISREDIVQLLDEKTEHIDAADRQLIQRVFAMTETTVEHCMTPLVDLSAISEEATIADAVSEMLAHGHSRLPVFRERVDNIVGVVTHRDLLFVPPGIETVAGLVRPVRFVPETKAADELLREMRQDGEPFAVVVDEYGGSVGVVTIEDLLEELIGEEIQDERDVAEPGIRRLGEREWRVPARVEIEELAEAIGHPLPEGDYETVAGLILSRTGRIPEPGELIRMGPFSFHIELANERAIQVVRLVVVR